MRSLQAVAGAAQLPVAGPYKQMFINQLLVRVEDVKSVQLQSE